MSGRTRVLVVDDDDELRAAVADYLEAHGFAPLLATNGLEALLHVKRNRPAAVVMDLMMPRLGGLDALKRMRAFDPSMTVVIATGTPDPALHERALAMGARAVLQKPFALAAMLAALKGEPMPAAPPGVPPAADTPAAEGLALVIDDDADTRDLLAGICAEQHLDTRVAVDGASGLRALADLRPDVVLLDIHMPGLNGVEVLPALHALAPDAKVVMVSGTPDAELSRRALALGAFDFVPKPIDLAYLRHTIETAVALRRLEG